jgi:hypothetical protein
VTIRRLSESVHRPPAVAGAPIGAWSRYTWRPRAGLATDLPVGFRIAMDCLAGRDGLRRFAPAGGLKAFLLEASLGGWAILSRVRNLDGEHRFAHHEMRLLFQQAPLLREHLGASPK